MTTITATTSNKKDVKVLKEILERFGIAYTLNESNDEIKLSDAELADFKHTQEDFLNGKTNSKSWNDIKNDVYGHVATERRDSIDRGFESFKTGSQSTLSPSPVRGESVSTLESHR